MPTWPVAAAATLTHSFALRLAITIPPPGRFRQQPAGVHCRARRDRPRNPQAASSRACSQGPSRLRSPLAWDPAPGHRRGAAQGFGVQDRRHPSARFRYPARLRSRKDFATRALGEGRSRNRGYVLRPVDHAPPGHLVGRKRSRGPSSTRWATLPTVDFQRERSLLQDRPARHQLLVASPISPNWCGMGGRK